MGAGISKEQERKAKYRRLQAVLRELRKAGVECRYGDKAVFGNCFRIEFGRTLRASNGECFGNMHVAVNGEDYWLIDAPAGIARVKALYGNERDRANVTELAWLIVQVENAVREGSRVENMGKPEFDVFLHNQDGSRFKTMPSMGMEPGQLYAYNEMQGDRPMLRIGPSNQYVELLPGMSVRWGDGGIIVERKVSNSFITTIEVCCHQVIVRYWDFTRELTDELKEALANEAEERAKACIVRGCQSGELQYLRVDDENEKEIRGYWEIERK